MSSHYRLPFSWINFCGDFNLQIKEEKKCENFVARIKSLQINPYNYVLELHNNLGFRLLSSKKVPGI